MRRLSAAVTIISTSTGAERLGITATACCSLSAAPPSLLVCVNRNSTVHDPICKEGKFSVNILSVADKEVALRFSSGNALTRFEVGSWTELASGNPALASAMVTFDCALTETIEAHTHSIFIGRIVEIIQNPDRKPLLYALGDFTSLSFVDDSWLAESWNSTT